MDSEAIVAMVAGLRAGDTAAFDAVHAAFNGRLFTFLMRLSRRREVAEDLLEETWLRLVAHAHRLRPDTQLAPWLFTVARNLWISHQRARAFEDSQASGLLGLWPSGHSHPSPFEEAAVNEAGRRIEAALNSLPSTYREVLLLVGVEEFRPIEAAAICGITPEAFRQRLSRARTMLAERLNGSEEAATAAALGEVWP
ncbi:MAG TPA: RNA polymerase sigma factor [Vicinamibacterales bacterium]|nr:RNA polymerase sigma factor [Vicinamibacterales bacterium]